MGEEFGPMDDLEEGNELSAVELEFKALCEEVLPQIEARINIARQAIKEAEELSEKYGVPFSSDITPISMGYMPASLDDRFRDLDSNIMYDLAGTYLDDYEGWEHSAVC